MSENTLTLTQKIDGLLVDCYQKAIEIVIAHGARRCQLFPEESQQTINADYFSRVVSTWKVHLTAPLIIDLSLYDETSKQSFLIERWQFVYKRRDDIKDGRFSAASKRIITFLRTLYCYVRLLPGFQLVGLTPLPSIVTFRVYSSEDSKSAREFVHESSFYEFPRIQTFRGTLFVGVRSATAAILQVRNTNHGSVALFRSSAVFFIEIFFTLAYCL
jgi:Autophagy-related protein 13